MRRLGPRRIDLALEPIVPSLRPATTLARVQEAWPGVVGDALAAEAQPVSERRGRVTVSCRSAVWAQELSLMSEDLLAHLNETLAGTEGAPVLDSLRFSAASPVAQL